MSQPARTRKVLTYVTTTRIDVAKQEAILALLDATADDLITHVEIDGNGEVTLTHLATEDDVTEVANAIEVREP